MTLTTCTSGFLHWPPTVGFGDLVAATKLGRMLAVTEALFGHMYLVTVIALLVAKFSRTPR